MIKLTNFLRLQKIAFMELFGVNHKLAILDYSSEGKYLERIKGMATAKIDRTPELRPYKAQLLSPDIFDHFICHLENVIDCDPAEIIGGMQL